MKFIVLFLLLISLASTCTIGTCLFCSGNICNSCMQGYYLSSGACNACMYTCKECIQKFTCTSCFDGYYYYPIDQVCKICQVINCGICITANSCSSCKDGYYLSNSACYRCMTGCRTCLSSMECASCSNNYYLNSTQCISCGPNCLECIVGVGYSSSSYPSNTAYNIYQGVCVTCNVGGCLTCSTNDVCAMCKDSFYLKGLSCLSCPLGCKTCSNQTICNSCSTNFHLNSSKYVSCGPNCIYPTES